MKEVTYSHESTADAGRFAEALQRRGTIGLKAALAKREVVSPTESAEA